MADPRSLEDKVSHVTVCADRDVETQRSPGFERYRLRPQPLPELDLDAVDTRVEVLGKKLAAPILIAPMSGGVEPGKALTRTLAETAQHHGLALGLGSQRIALERPELREGFFVRDVAPDILLFANLGAVNLRKGLGPEDCLAVVQMAEADALMLHVNPMQEAVQGGDTCFGDLYERIGRVCEALSKHDVPVLVREVSSGMPAETAARLASLGVAGVDTGGAGGTSWAYVEGLIAEDPVRQRAGEVFRDWGISTCESLEALSAAGLASSESADEPWVTVATGGLRTGLDLAKALALGATIGGFALPFLRAFMQGGREAADLLAAQLRFELSVAMFGCAAATVSELGRERLLSPL